ncbi:hypothetical protein [Streptomyces tanashiensis]|uniref:hypothetical protein n=1 Tax=Streptomyces tanashiensis TaxID=67367 RepID=UPI00343F594E
MREHDTRERQAGSGADAPPVYPGESTEISGREQGAGLDIGTDTDVRTRTDPGRNGDRARDEERDEDRARDEERDGDRARDEEERDEDRNIGTEADTRTDSRTDSTTETKTDADTGRSGEPNTQPGLDEDTARTEGAATPAAEDEPPILLESGDEEAFRTRWHEIQSQFVDDPREAVHAADALVTDVIRKLAATFSDRKKDLEEQWNEGEDVDTESLRMALRQYRSFFNRLLTT